MILPIVTEPNPVLHQETEPISEITPEIIQLVQDMRETMHNAQGIGLAAPQIGQSVSLCIVEYASEDPTDYIPYTVLINPRITWKGGAIVNLIEACLSIPGVEGLVKRPIRIRVKAKNLEGESFEITTKGLFARVLQHEIDHLHGILFTSYISKKKLLKRPLVDYPCI